MAKNIPRIYLDVNLSENIIIKLDKETSHYLKNVMRTKSCLVFNDGIEYTAELSDDAKSLNVGAKTNNPDSKLDITFCFSVIKKTDELLNMIAQFGVARIQPVITERTVAKHINWDRCKKIIIQSAEQSGQNSVPKLLPVIKFEDLDKSEIVFADERIKTDVTCDIKNCKSFIIGPEGGFSDTEFDILEKSGGIGVSLGKTILRAEVAAVAGIVKIL